VARRRGMHVITDASSSAGSSSSTSHAARQLNSCVHQMLLQMCTFIPDTFYHSDFCFPFPLRDCNGSLIYAALTRCAVAGVRCGPHANPEP
jgi:hypothetical protein